MTTAGAGQRRRGRIRLPCGRRTCSASTSAVRSWRQAWSTVPGRSSRSPSSRRGRRKGRREASSACSGSAAARSRNRESIRADVVGVGIGAGGPLDTRLGILTAPPHLPGWLRGAAGCASRARLRAARRTGERRDGGRRGRAPLRGGRRDEPYGLSDDLDRGRRRDRDRWPSLSRRERQRRRARPRNGRLRRPALPRLRPQGLSRGLCLGHLDRRAGGRSRDG